MMNKRSKPRVMVLDGQGGGVGARLVKLLLPVLPNECELLCVGTDVLATNAMLKAGATQGATGENAVLYHAARADLILGPLGIILANGIFGEVSPTIANAVSGADVTKILIPTSTCGVIIAGTEDCKLEQYIQRALKLAQEVLRL